MKREYPNLCEPIKLGSVTFRNRMFSAPIGATDITADCSPGPRTQGFYELRAKGGAAAVTVSELVVHPATDASHMLHLNLQTPGQLGAFTFIAEAISRHGAVPSVELSHSGQYAGTYLVDKDKKSAILQYGPSDGTRPDGLPVKALTIAQIKDIVASYGEAATLAKRAGFKMLMVHGGHGWLINQFLSPFFNHRSDEYGGAFEGRVRLAREILATVREAVGPGFPIEFRMSGSELFDGGYGIDEGVKIAQAVEEYIDMVHVSAGSYQFGFSITHPSMFRPHGVNVHLAAEIKKHVKIAVATIGGLSAPEQMEEILSSGQADVIYMARELLADPEFPAKVVSNRGAETIKCLRCFVCMAERAVTQTRRCTINPRIGRELEGMDIYPAAVAKKVLVIGGGIAGMFAATTAKERGHEVVLLEQSDTLGGILKAEQALPFKHEMYELTLKYADKLARLGVEVRLNTTADAALVDSLRPDAVIVAVGSVPVVPPLLGIDSRNVIAVSDFHLRQDEVKEDVIVLGGGLSGCECAIELAKRGKNVKVVQKRDSVAPDANIRHRPILLAEMEAENIEILCGLEGVSVASDGLLCKDEKGHEVLVSGETIICAVGQRARREVAAEFVDSAPFVREIGDCVRPANITTAIYEAYHAALDI